MKYSNHQTKYIGKQVGLRAYQHPLYKIIDGLINYIKFMYKMFVHIIKFVRISVELVR